MSKHDWTKSRFGDPAPSPADERGDGPASNDREAGREAGYDGEGEAQAEQPQGHADDGRPRTLDRALDQLDLLREQLAAKTEEAAQIQDRLLRERAELENFKRRMQRDKTEALRFACEPLLRDLLPVIDNLERAVGAAEGDDAQGNRAQSLITGVKLVLQQFGEVLSRYGVTRIASSGQAFDPSQHEAVAQVESEAEPGSVVDEYASGYRLHDRLLRPAQVTVAKPPRAH